MTNATWKAHPASSDYDADGNWTGGKLPDGTAFFGTSSRTSLTFSATATTIGGWTFKQGAAHYVFDAEKSLSFEGAGIAVQGGSVKITVHDDLHFVNSSKAGSAHIVNDLVLDFNDTSSAGRAHITNNALLGFATGFSFGDSSTAGKAVIANEGGIEFADFSTAGAATITNDGDIVFHDLSSAGSASITDNGAMEFHDTSGANFAHITVGGLLNFYDTSGAAQSVITTSNQDAAIIFRDNSDGGMAQLHTKAGGSVDFSQSSGTGGHHLINIGSVAGAATFNLGANDLAVGSFAPASTNVSGLIEGTGTLIKQGAGTLILSHIGNTYSGGTEIDLGTLDVAAAGAAGTFVITFGPAPSESKGPTLKIENAALTNSGSHTHSFDNTVTNFGFHDTIDLAGLKFVNHATATISGGELTVKSGKAIDTITMLNPADMPLKTVNDGHGGTKVVFVAPPAKPAAEQAADALSSTHRAELHASGTDLLAANEFSFGDLAIGEGAVRLSFASAPEGLRDAAHLYASAESGESHALGIDAHDLAVSLYHASTDLLL